jgi:beta-carotene/zeaxanthin 4-ketolase
MGIGIAFLILFLWAGNLVYALEFLAPDPTSPWTWLHVAAQTYLFTGLFITAHDAMHGTVSAKGRVNTAVGTLCSLLFAGMSYRRLKRNHRLHHKHPGTEEDPDYSTRWRNPVIWWFTFLLRYTTVMQIVVMGALYNLLMLRYSQGSLWLFWLIPAFIGTFQLFYFGTYLPHRLPHTEGMKPHNARSQRRQHVLAMLSCYFFGYHYEHHESPGTPWWRLATLRDEEPIEISGQKSG